MPTIDFQKAIQDAKGASFEALPIGDYDVEVAKSEAVTSGNGKPMIKVTFKVISGPYEKRSVINNFVLSLENAMATAIFFRHMKAFGLTEDWFASLGQQQSLEPVASALLGRRVRLNLGQREWNGEMRNEVKGVKPYTGAPTAPGAPGAPLPGGNGFPAGPVPPQLGQVAPAGPAVAPAPVAPPAPPVAPVAQAPVAPPAPPQDAPPLPPAAPQVQSVPQPPAAPVVPTSTESTSPAYAASAGSGDVQSTPSASPPATSEVAQPTPPQLPF